MVFGLGHSIFAVLLTTTAISFLLYKAVRPERIKRSTLLSLFESCIALLTIIGIPFYLVATSYDVDQKAYPYNVTLFLLLAVPGAVALWHLVKVQLMTQKPRHLVIRVFAGLIAFVSLFLFLLGPLFLFRVTNGIPLDGEGSKWEIWLLIFGGAVGAGVARAVHDSILISSGHFSSIEIDMIWRGKGP